MIIVKVYGSDGIMIVQSQAQSEIRFGRGFDQDLIIPRLGLSRAQGVVYFHNGDVFVKNLSPEYFMEVNNKRLGQNGEIVVPGMAKVKINDELSMEIVYQREKKQVRGQTTTNASAKTSLTNATSPINVENGTTSFIHPIDTGITKITQELEKTLILDCIRGKYQGKSFVVEHNYFVIGRGKNVSLFLDDEMLSKEHIRIVLDGDRFVLEDLNSINGVFVNQIKTSNHELKGGEHLELGNNVFRVRIVSDKAYEALQAVDHEVQQLFPEINSSSVNEKNNSSHYHTKKSKPKSLLERYKKLPAKKRNIYSLAALIVFVALFVGPEPTKTKSISDKNQKKNQEKLTGVAALSPEVQAQIRKHYQRANEFYQQKEFENAKAELQALSNLYPEPYEDSASLMLQVNNEIEKNRRITEARERQIQIEEERKKIQSLVEYATTLVKRRDFDQAQSIFFKIEERDPENPDVASLKAEIDEYKLIQEEKRKKAELYKKNYSIIAKKLDAAKGEYRAGRYLAAIESAKKVLDEGFKIKKLRSNASSIINNSTKKINELEGPLLEEANALSQTFDLTSLLQAKKNYQKVIEINPKNEQARTKLKDLREFVNKRMKAIYSEAIVLESLGDRAEARQRYEQIINSSFEDDEYFEKAKLKLENYVIEQSVN